IVLRRLGPPHATAGSVRPGYDDVPTTKALPPGRWAADVPAPSTMTIAARQNHGQADQLGFNFSSRNGGVAQGHNLHYHAPLSPTDARYYEAPITKGDIRYQTQPRPAPENDPFWSSSEGNGHRG